MATSAFQIQYRQQLIDGFEQRESLLRMSATTEYVNKGGSAVFCVADSNSAEASTRGLNGNIPYRSQNLNQNTATLQEWHDLVRLTGFNIFASQGDQVAQMQKDSVGVINRKIDDIIIDQLETITANTGAAGTMSFETFLHSHTILQNNEVPNDGQINFVITPAAFAYLAQTTEFASADYVNVRPVQDGQTAFDDSEKLYKWLNINVIVHPRLPGAGTAAEKCFMYHRSSIGHAMDTGGMQTFVNYDEEQDYSYARCSGYMGTKLLQQSGGVVINHDGSAYAAS